MYMHALEKYISTSTMPFARRYSEDVTSDVTQKTLLIVTHKPLNFHPLEVVYRYRDPQHQVGENCWY